MSKKEIDPETASQIKKELAELRAQLENQKKSKKKSAKQTKLTLADYDNVQQSLLKREESILQKEKKKKEK